MGLSPWNTGINPPPPVHNQRSQLVLFDSMVPDLPGIHLPIHVTSRHVTRFVQVDAHPAAISRTLLLWYGAGELQSDNVNTA